MSFKETEHIKRIKPSGYDGFMNVFSTKQSRPLFKKMMLLLQAYDRSLLSSVFSARAL